MEVRSTWPAQPRAALWIAGALVLFLIALASVRPPGEPSPSSVLRPTEAASLLAAPDEFEPSQPLQRDAFAPSEPSSTADERDAASAAAAEPSAVVREDRWRRLANGPFGLEALPGRPTRHGARDYPLRSNLDRLLGLPHEELWSMQTVEQLVDVDALALRLDEGRMPARWAASAERLVAGRDQNLQLVLELPTDEDLDRIYADDELRDHFTLWREIKALERWLTRTAPDWPAAAVDAALASIQLWFHRHAVDMADAFALVERARLSDRPQQLPSPFRRRVVALRREALVRAETVTGKPFELLVELDVLSAD